MRNHRVSCLGIVLIVMSTSMRCSLDASHKLACNVDSDCLDGYGCRNSVCTLGVQQGQQPRQGQQEPDAADATPPLAAPSHLQGNNVGTDFRLSWQDNSQTETGFEIERGIGMNPLMAYLLLSTTDANTTQYVTRFYKDAMYAFRVRAVAGSTYSDYSDVLIVPSPTLSVSDPSQSPERPTVTYRRTGTSWMQEPTYAITWKSVDFRGTQTERGYNVYETIDGMDDTWDLVASLPAETLAYQVIPQLRTAYGVTAFNSSGESDYATVTIDPTDDL